MKLGKHEFRMRHRRVWLVLLGVPLVVLVLWGIYVAIFGQRTNPPEHAVRPSVAPQHLHPSSFQATRRLFGPWHAAPPGSTGAPRLVMLLGNGGTDVSSKVVRVSGNWHEASAFEITAVVSAHGRVRIGTTDNNAFNLHYGQAFILQERPDAVYGFVRDKAGKAKLVSTTVSALTKR